MAITVINTNPNYPKREYQGLSTDTKQTNCADGSTFLELDTGKFFVYDSVNLGSTNGWWFTCLLKLA